MTNDSFSITVGHLYKKVSVKKKRAFFTVKNKNGRFFIQVQGQDRIALCLSLREGVNLCIIGSLKTYIAPQCNSNHMYIQANIILPLADDISQQIEQLFLPAMFQSIYNQALTNVSTIKMISDE